MVMCCFIYMVSVTSYSKLLRQLSKADIDSEMQNIIANVAVLVNVKYSIWVQVGITQNCTLFNVMQRQGQEKDEQAVRREQRRGVEDPPPPRSFILFLSSPLHPSALLLFFFSIIPLVLAVPFNLSVNVCLFCKRER